MWFCVVLFRLFFIIFQNLKCVHLVNYGMIHVSYIFYRFDRVAFLHSVKFQEARSTLVVSIDLELTCLRI